MNEKQRFRDYASIRRGGKKRRERMKEEEGKNEGRHEGGKEAKGNVRAEENKDELTEKSRRGHIARV